MGYIKAHRVDGLGLRRQMPIGGYVIDFICLAAKLVVELDGESHDFISRQIMDARHDAFHRVSKFYRVALLPMRRSLTNHGIYVGEQFVVCLIFHF